MAFKRLPIELLLVTRDFLFDPDVVLDWTSTCILHGLIYSDQRRANLEMGVSRTGFTITDTQNKI
jgi:hypothetical protein